MKFSSNFSEVSTDVFIHDQNHFTWSGLSDIIYQRDFKYASIITLLMPKGLCVLVIHNAG